MRIGYARVSTHDQTLNLQLDALREAGCEQIFSEHASGAKADRPELARALEVLRPGDMLMVWRLDRLGRSVRHLVDTVAKVAARGIDFRSLRESIDTTTSAGRLVFHIFASLAEFERDLIRDRTLAGIAAARARGDYGGRPALLSPQETEALRMAARSPGVAIEEICAAFGVRRSTCYKALGKGGFRALRAADALQPAWHGGEGERE